MKMYLKTVWTIIVIPMLLLTFAQNTTAGPSAYCYVSFEIHNPDDFGIAIEWTEEPDGPEYDYGYDLFWYDNDAYDFFELETPIDVTISKDKSLWSRAKGADVWEMKTASYASLPLPLGSNSAKAGVEGNIYNPSGYFVAMEDGVMVVELTYSFVAKAKVDGWLQRSSVIGAFDIFFENTSNGENSNRHFYFDIDKKNTGSQKYSDKDTIVLRLNFKQGQEGRLHWMFMNETEVRKNRFFSVAKKLSRD